MSAQRTPARRSGRARTRYLTSFSLSGDTFRTLEELASFPPIPLSPPPPIPRRRSRNPKVERPGGREGDGVAEGSLAGKAPAFAFTP